MSRREARKHIFCLLFMYSFRKCDDFETLQQDYLQNIQTMEEADLSFIKNDVQSVITNICTVDAKIKKFLKDWDLDRIAKTDLAVLRHGVYELLFKHLSEKVIINEAVQIAKTYGNNDSQAFVNGVLASVSKEVVK